MSSHMQVLERLRPSHNEIDRPNRAEAEAAFRTIIRWAGDDPQREGLTETPGRVARAFHAIPQPLPRS